MSQIHIFTSNKSWKGSLHVYMIKYRCGFLCVCGSSRPPEQSDLKLVCSDFERSELSSDINVRSWCIQESTREVCKADAEIASSLPAAQREAGM